MNIDFNMELYIPNLDKFITKKDILKLIDSLDIGLVENAYITPGLLLNSATVIIDWNNDKKCRDIQSLINCVDKIYYIFDEIGNKFSIFNKANLSALKSIEKPNSIYLDTKRIEHDLNSSSCCGKISGGWQFSQPSI
tara:strand:+ start:735 stop:1145 length:411 start_codon:yes stop_codon:yes gene_type:complete